MHIVIIGAGAAGCFAAITLKRECPAADVTLLERAARPLTKVAVTGGGRCNLTNSFAHVKSLEQVYPRGHRLMKRLFHQFSPAETCEWFEKEGVELVTQDDDCIFPRSQNAQQIVHTLLDAIRQSGVELITNAPVQSIRPCADGFLVQTPDKTYSAQRVLLTAGGQPKASGYAMLDELNLSIVPPVPSLFTLSLADDALKALMGTVLPHAAVSLAGTPWQADGALLITHWGVSGPAVLRLSSYAARELAESGYKGNLCIRWTGTRKQEEVEQELRQTAAANRQKKITSVHPAGIQTRLWEMLVGRAGIAADARWSDLQGKALNRLVETLTADVYAIAGKFRFKEEFVTCGGVALNELNQTTLEAKQHPGLYVAGELADVDAVTGGFNLQAAWTMGHVAAHHIACSLI